MVLANRPAFPEWMAGRGVGVKVGSGVSVAVGIGVAVSVAVDSAVGE